MMITKQEVQQFEDEIAELYEAGKIRGPVHLRDGGEDELWEIFSQVGRDDFVFSTWANHRHALLKGIPPEKVRQRILDCDSMAMSFPEFRFYTSAIVGGIASIATGTAHTCLGTGQRVWCFLGDMSFRTGVAHESIMYSIGNKLPISFVVEDNGKSVGTDTVEVCGVTVQELLNKYQRMRRGDGNVEFYYYSFDSKFPHSGTGHFISF
jgi:TPP-dependent pyruvate/acetoin dehydrogenase alpha subunit